MIIFSLHINRYNIFIISIYIFSFFLFVYELSNFEKYKKNNIFGINKIFIFGPNHFSLQDNHVIIQVSICNRLFFCIYPFCIFNDYLKFGKKINNLFFLHFPPWKKNIDLRLKIMYYVCKTVIHMTTLKILAQLIRL